MLADASWSLALYADARAALLEGLNSLPVARRELGPTYCWRWSDGVCRILRPAAGACAPLPSASLRDMPSARRPPSNVRRHAGGQERDHMLLRSRSISGITMIRVGMTAALLATAAANGGAQFASVVRCEEGGNGVVSGVLLDDSTEVGIGDGWVYLYENCRARSDGSGRFVLSGVSPGERRFGAGARGYREFRPVVHSVSDADTTKVQIRLRAGGPLEDCRADPECAPLVEGGNGPLDEADGLRLVAYGMIIALAWETVSEGEPWVACLAGGTDHILEALRERYPAVAPDNECALGGAEGERLRRRMTHSPTGSQAFLLSIDGVREDDPAHRSASLSYVVGPLWANGWDCEFSRTDRGWRPTLCSLVWES